MSQKGVDKALSELVEAVEEGIELKPEQLEGTSSRRKVYVVWQFHAKTPEVGEVVSICQNCNKPDAHGQKFKVISRTFGLVETGVVPVLGLIKVVG